MSAELLNDEDRRRQLCAVKQAQRDFLNAAQPYFEELAFLEAGYRYPVSMTIHKDGSVTTTYAEYPPEVAKYKENLEGMIEFIRDQAYRKARMEHHIPSRHD